MRVIAAILATFLLVGSIWAVAVHSKDQPLSKIVFYVS